MRQELVKYLSARVWQERGPNVRRLEINGPRGRNEAQRASSSIARDLVAEMKPKCASSSIAKDFMAEMKPKCAAKSTSEDLAAKMHVKCAEAWQKHP